MHLPTVLTALLASTAAAMPAQSPANPLVSARQVNNFRCQPLSYDPRPTVMRTMMFRDDFCQDDCQHRDQLDDKSDAREYGNAWPVSGRRSIKFEVLDERFNCDVTTWSGRDGRGLSLFLRGAEKNKECVSVLYGSFSYYCWRK